MEEDGRVAGDPRNDCVGRAALSEWPDNLAVFLPPRLDLSHTAQEGCAIAEEASAHRAHSTATHLFFASEQ